MMTSTEFISKAKDIVQNHKTLYVLGGIGGALMGANVTRYCNNLPYNRQAARTAMIKAAANKTPPVFGFDCVGLIKSILWGWEAKPFTDVTTTYGGAKYQANNVPDYSADQMITLCPNRTTNFSNIVPGEVVHLGGHIGIYLGEGIVAECTPAFGNCVQFTVLKNISNSTKYPQRTWTDHGKLPFVDYSAQATGPTQPPPAPEPEPDLDVPSSWATDAWEWAKEAGITDGTNPRGPCTREQVATMLYRITHPKEKNSDT